MSIEQKGLAQPSQNRSKDSEVLVRVDQVGKVFCRDFKKSLLYGLKDSARDLLSGKKSPKDGERELRPGEFWANKEISFELRRGECIGLIGHNGAGKTTLLKILNGLIKPDSGRIEMRGRVGALIALGAGFNPLLTGRENVYVAGSVLGLSKIEIDQKYDEICEFAEINEFMDSPVQTYSSGMNVRLGFGIASALNPDILIVDEILAVGDANFRVKCHNKIRDLLPTTGVVLVSHNMFDIGRTCSKILVLNGGRPAFLGGVREGTDVYSDLQNAGDTAGVLSYASDGTFSDVRLHSLVVSNNARSSDIKISLELNSLEKKREVGCYAVFFDSSETHVGIWMAKDHNQDVWIEEGGNLLTFDINDVRITSGVYRVALVLTNISDNGYHLRIDQGIRLKIDRGVTIGPSYRI